jgi:tetratricopeptide (TPR) repeat protein/CHAT domain-containing protein
VPKTSQQQIDQKRQQVVELYERGQYERAIPIAARVCDLTRQAYGQDHPDYAGSLNNLAEVYRVMGNYTAAEPLFRQALDITQQALGKNHPEVAPILGNLAETYRAMGNYAAAEPLYRQAVKIERKAFGADSPEVATSLNNLAILYATIGNYAAAEPLYRQAIDIRRQALGEGHPQYATVLNNLASLYRAMGNYAAAEPLYRQALGILQRALGEDHPQFGVVLNNLALQYQEMGNYTAAEPVYRQALDIVRRTLGEDHPEYATTLSNLASLYQAMGNYAAAEPLYRQALEIRRRALGEDHPDSAESLDDLAELYRLMGNYAAAEPLYRQALDIVRQALGEGHPLYATVLHNLALLHEEMGNHAAAEPLCRQALNIVLQAQGENHPDLVPVLKNLAVLYQGMGNYTAAEALYRQALDIVGKAFGEDHPEYAGALNNLSALYYVLGNYDAAEPLCRQAVEIRRRALGENHPDYAGSLSNLGTLCVATNREAEAMPLMQEAAAIDDRMIGQVFSIGSESRRMAYLRTLEVHLHAFLSLVLQYPSCCREREQAGLELVLRRKAIGAEALAVQRDAVLGGRYPALEPKMQELATWRRQIAQKALTGPGPDGPQAHQQLLAEWTARKERLEEELARQIPEMHLDQRLRAANRQAVAQALPEASALIEFVRFPVCDFEAVPARGEPRWKPAHYLGFVVLAGEPEAVEMVDLGEAGPIDDRVAAFRASITGGAERRDLEAEAPEAAEAPGDGAALRAAVFDRLLPALGGRTRLFLAPDGDLTRLPFEALPVGGERYLIDGYQISYLSAGRDVIRFGAVATGLPGPALVAADPDFDLGAQARPRPAEAGDPPRRQSRDLDRGSLRFRRLPGTRAEGERIAKLLGVQPLLSGAVLETRLKSHHSPGILHIATHGFFLPNQKHDPNQERLAFGTMADRLGRLSTIENPLLRSGLALAGANTWCQGGVLPDEAEDAILNGEDVAGMDLLDTGLVVLSACETGLGEVQVGEGVFGLRRAFVLAGARTLVMSLWKVPDQETQELMLDFYQRILAGRPRAEALREAQLAMKARCSSPLYWGAFICQGDPGLVGV